LQLVDYAFDVILRKSERHAYEVGIVGGSLQLRGPHKALLKAGDPAASVLAVRFTWRLSFNFGELQANLEGNDRVVFLLSGYQDISPAHAYMTAGWGAAAARLAGAESAKPEVLEGPWNGHQVLKYQVTF
jgi:hypothetical protein